MDINTPQLKSILQSFDSEISSSNHEQLEEKYLGKNGLLNEQLRQIGQLPKEERSAFGKEANLLKQYISEKLGSSDRDLLAHRADQKNIDPTAPFDINSESSKRPSLLSQPGSQHPITKEMEHVLRVFESMGFAVEDCRQLDDDYNMFEALNIPKGHPARDIWDTFWTDENLIPPAHTSTMQNRVLRSYKPPIRVVVPGRCYRNEATDASHEHTLHQVEGIYVDKGISLGDMIGTIQKYLEGFFEKQLKVKVQPAFFPFTEPSLEFMISCPFCNQSGCKTCGYAGWMEVMGCGMIHPKVLIEAGIDPNEYSGFAWGFGLDRLVMIKNGIEDIRWMQEGNLQFIKQF